MTREEAISIMNVIIHMLEPQYDNDRVEEAVEMAIKALEQEPCEDAISREKAKQFLYERLDRLNNDELYDIFSRVIDDMYNELPPVTPQPKKGHWIEHDCKALREIGYYRCSECNHGYQRYERGARKSEVPYINGQKYELHRIDNFCPNCGAKMESEGK